MARIPRAAAEIEKVNNHILVTAQDIIIKEGYDALSMRRLAQKLGVSATTIYRYYSGKDALYLNILIKGFEEFYEKLYTAYEKGDTPYKKIRNYIAEYIDFGIKKANLYNIMMVWNVPKYYDFVGTASEGLAKKELDTAIRIEELIEKVFTETGVFDGLSRQERAAAALRLKCCVHGFISFYNSQIVSYLKDISDVGYGPAVKYFIDSLLLAYFPNI